MRTLLSLTAALLAAIAAAPAPAASQAYAELQPGARLRLEGNRRVEATVLSRKDDSVTIAAGRGGARTLALASLRDVAVFRGRSRASGARVGALWGTGAGLLLGAVVASGDSAVNEGALIAFATYNAAVTGAVIGAIAGRERWVRYEPPTPAPGTPGSSGPLARLAPGTRVRVSAPGVLAPEFTGTVLEQTRDSLRVSGEGGIPVAIAVAAITALEQSAGRGRWRGAWVGAGIGALIGGGALGLLASTDAQSNTGQALLEGAVGGAFWGGVIGALVGSDDWKRVQPVTAWAPASRRLQIGARITTP